MGKWALWVLVVSILASDLGLTRKRMAETCFNDSISWYLSDSVTETRKQDYFLFLFYGGRFLR